MSRKKEGSMKKTIWLILVGLIFILTNTANALDISLAWDASPSSNVVGYKLYYQADTPSLPLAGNEALQGSSPIDIGPNTAYSVTGLTDNKIYYFAVTAYDAAGYESAYSNIVASGWVPPLTAPSNGLVAQPTIETFNWETAPAPYDVTYTLYYGTDQQLTAFLPPPLTETQGTGLQPILLFSLLALLGLILANNRKTRPALATGVLALTLGLSLAGCGGGGGSTDGTITGPIYGTVNTVTVNTGTDNYHVALDLKPATTYYWKVVANDQTTLGLAYESLTYSFTTAAN